MHKPWIQTNSGKPWIFENPDPANVDIKDIALALSNICRYTGHTREFYSVAAHSIVVARILKDQGYHPFVQLQGLLHDAHEAYVGDLSRPLKKLCPEYSKWEQIAENTVAVALNIPEVKHPAVKRADMTAFYAEKALYFPTSPYSWGDESKYDKVTLGHYAVPEFLAYDEFLALYSSLNTKAGERGSKSCNQACEGCRCKETPKEDLAKDAQVSQERV